MGFFDFIFPKYCVSCKKLGSHLCSDCFSYLSFDVNGICLVCGRPSIDGLTHLYCRKRYAIDGVFSALNYKGPVKRLIYQFKYKPYLTDLKTVISDLFYESLIQKEELNKILNQALPAGRQGDAKIFVPIPLYKSKEKSRGYNQAEILAEELGRRLGVEVQNLLERTKNTKSQVGLKKEERKENMEGAFKVISDKRQATRDKIIFLVDDVLTTGSTLLEAASVLKRKGAKRVYGLTLAKD